MPTKADWRRRFRAQREALTQSQVDADSEAIRRHVVELPEIANASSIFIYASTASEVQTYTLIEDLLASRKTVTVPRITDPDAGTMDAVVIHSLKDLVPDHGRFNLLAPRGSQTLDGPAEVIIMPGLAFSPTTGARLGMGGGYYDRYLSNQVDHPGFRLGLAFEAQLTDGWPVEPHDHPVHAVATPKRVLRAAAAP
ncbi:MAG: 5-formyltetrahydrofolate cyclo-ligase [Planctomycetota bacterium]